MTKIVQAIILKILLGFVAGFPQWGQIVADELISFPHSLHLMSDKLPPLCFFLNCYCFTAYYAAYIMKISTLAS